MTAEPALNFGPEWLRALSQGNGTTAVNPSTSPPSSPEIPKYKLAEFRYGREEMLALFSKDIKMPRDLRQFNGLVKEICQMPMALLEFTEEEQKLWSRSVNSEAVIRLMGKGVSSGITGPPAHRGSGGRGGSSVDRGRGRGRAGFYQRGLSSEDLELTTPGGLTRQRSYERTNSDRNSAWEDGFRDRKYDKPFSARDEEAGTTIRKDGSAPLDWRSGNLRSNHTREGDIDENGRRIGTPRTDKWSRSNWRSDRDERHAEAVTDWSGTSRTPYRKSTGGHVRLRDHDFNEGDTLPEWSIEDNKDADKVGTFDATGAFLDAKEDKEIDGIITEKFEEAESSDPSNLSSENSSSNVSHENSIEKSDPLPNNIEIKPNFSIIKSTEYKDDESDEEVEVVVAEIPVSKQLPNKIECEPIPEVPTLPIFPEPIIIDKKEDINFEHLEKAAESLVNTIEEDEKVAVNQVSNLANVWYYRDPQGVIQGPFSDLEMAEWFRTGYFDMGLMVRQGVTGRFCTLGELSNMRNCVPFMPSKVLNGEPAPTPRPPISTNQPVRGLLGGLTNHTPMPVPHQFDVVNEQEQQMRLLQQQMYHQRLMQQQYQQRFTARQPIQQLLGGGNPVESMAALNPSTQQQQQQYYLMQKLLAQQQQPPGGLTRNPNQENTNAVLDPVRQLAAQLAASQPAMQMKEDGTSLWNMATPSPPVASRIGPNLDGNWRPKSVWDIDSHEKLLAATLMQTEQQLLVEEQKKKRLAEEELRNQREEEDRRRRLQEEQEQRERLRLEELRRREEEERREKEELLKKQQIELEERRRRESEERRFREEEERRLKEERLKLEQLRKQEEERLKQEEFFILQQKEQQRLEELKRKEKRRQMEEEEKIKAEHQRELKQAEALKKLHDKQKQKQGPAWGGSVLTTDNALSLAEIQRLQEEKEQQEKINRECQQQHILQQQIQNQLLVQQQQQQARSMTNMTWAEKSNVVHGPVKSLLEIQNEEAEKLAQQKEKQSKQQLQQLQQQQQQQQALNALTLSSASVWNNSNSHLRQTNNSSVSYPWNTENTTHQMNGGLYFWDEQNVNTNKAKGQSTPASSKKETHTTSNGQTPKAKTTRSKKEEEMVMKLFEAPKLNGDEFTEWCIQALSELQSTIDVPTFVSFLKDVDSPYEVHDYVKQYLGEGKEVHNFTKMFLENRSKYRNQARKNQSEENMWGPARAINPSLSKTQINELDGFKSAGGKKKKKSKMQKIDSTILGFTVHAAMDRINIGDIDHGEDM